MVIPSHIQIEIVKGICTANCIMCPVPSWNLEPLVMSLESYSAVMDKIKIHKDSIKFLTLQGRGEPLLDESLCEKIKIAWQNLRPSTSIGFASNCTELTPDLSRNLLESGLDLIICSIDGIKKGTHENIRIGTNYDEVVENVKNFIKLRNDLNKTTRVMIRFIRQESNYDEWDDYRKYWSEFIDIDKNDSVVKFDVHNWGGVNINKENIELINDELNMPFICEELYNRFVIQCDGSIGLCCVSDDVNDLNLGNIFNGSLVEIYNGDMFKHYRQEMEAGNIFKLELCKNCSVPLSRYKRQIS